MIAQCQGREVLVFIENLLGFHLILAALGVPLLSKLVREPVFFPMIGDLGWQCDGLVQWTGASQYNSRRKQVTRDAIITFFFPVI